MKLKRGAALIFAGVVALASAPVQLLAQGPPPPGYQEGYGHESWEAPPPELQEIGRRGFHDGIEGARKDYENHRPPNVNNRDEYRHPDVPHEARREYRDAFRRGYDTGVEHLMHGYHH